MPEMFQELSTQIRDLLWPKDFFAWQTLLLLSVFSLVIAASIDALPDSSPLTIEVLSTLSWIFFTSAIWWALTKNPVKVGNFSISPWITGAVLCLFLFRPWIDTRFRWALSSWPLISTAVMALPDFVKWDLQVKLPKKETQQLLIMTLLINLLLSSWILFYFRVQDWVSHYPSLLVSSLDASEFVYDLARTERTQQSQGVPLLEGTAEAIEGELTDLPWYQTERWLYTRQSRLEEITQRMLTNLSAPDEQVFWRMAVPEPQRLGEGYRLVLRATWLGPVSQDAGFFLEKSCKIYLKREFARCRLKKINPPRRHR
ncbi:MAG: DUF5357 domain-containing protein [Phormidesmis sp. RL_2_1]|nr:DUF5357 domain-containing protein [Phormidesmis sp. RL_2_1]